MSGCSPWSSCQDKPSETEAKVEEVVDDMMQKSASEGQPVEPKDVVKLVLPCLLTCSDSKETKAGEETLTEPGQSGEEGSVKGFEKDFEKDNPQVPSDDTDEIYESGTVSHTGSPKSPSHRSLSSLTTSVPALLKFVYEVGVRLLPSMMCVFVVGYFSGTLMYMAGQVLIEESEKPENEAWAANWIWRDHRSLDLKIFNDDRDAELMNSTYVQIYATKHRVQDIDPGAPKAPSIWVIAYYARMAGQAWLSFSAPWVLFVLLKGWSNIWKYFLVFYVPIFGLVLSYVSIAAWWTLTHDEAIHSDVVQNVGACVVSLVQILGVVPWVARKIGICSPWKMIVLPYILLNASLFLLKYFMPFFVMNNLESDWQKVAFRLFVFPFTAEIFIGITRVLMRLVPTAESRPSQESMEGEKAIRPEEFQFLVLPQVAFFSYWGRLLMIGLKDTQWIWIANVGLGTIELSSRTTTPSRDRLYIAALMGSFSKMEDFWGKQGDKMKRFRSSLIYSHLVTEHLMIAFASSYYLGSGISVDLWQHWYNTFVQILTEAAVDLMALYIEVIKHKVPIVPAWNNRHPRWMSFFAFFIFAMTFIMVAHGGMYFCALRNPSGEDESRQPLFHYDYGGIVMTFCGGEK